MRVVRFAYRTLQLEEHLLPARVRRAFVHGSGGMLNSGACLRQRGGWGGEKRSGARRVRQVVRIEICLGRKASSSNDLRYGMLRWSRWIRCAWLVETVSRLSLGQSVRWDWDRIFSIYAIAIEREIIGGGLRRASPVDSCAGWRCWTVQLECWLLICVIISVILQDLARHVLSQFIISINWHETKLDWNDRHN